MPCPLFAKPQVSALRICLRCLSGEKGLLVKQRAVRGHAKKIKNDKGAKAEPSFTKVLHFDSGAARSRWQAEIT